MDSKLVVEQMSGRWKIKHPDMKPLAAEAARILPPAQVTYEWIPREQNKHADRLANEAMDAGKRGEQWSPSASTAELDARSARGRQRPVRGAGNCATSHSGPQSDDSPQTPDVRATPERRAGAPREGRGELRDRPRRPDQPARLPSPTPANDRSRRPSRAERGLDGADRWARAPPDLGAPTTFVLLRHGETPLTPQKRFSGSGGSDPSLSDVGRDQAERVATALAARGTIQAIVVVPPRPARRETAAAVAARLGLDVTDRGRAARDGLRRLGGADVRRGRASATRTT